MKILPKAALLFTALAAAPVAAMVLLFLPRYGEAVRAAEQRSALLSAAEVNALVVRQVDAVLADAQAVAAAVGHASEVPSEEAEAAVLATRLVLATRPTIDLARVEVPERGISTVLAKPDADPALCPSSTEGLRAEAERAGHASAVLDGRRAVLVLPIPRTRAAQGSAPPAGFVTVPVYLQGLSLDLRTLAEARGLDASTGSNVVVLDRDRRVVAATGAWGLEAGADGESLPFYSILPEGRTAARVEVQQDRAFRGAPTSLTVVSAGNPQGDASLGWLIGIARPHATVYAELTRTRRVFYALGGGTLVAALFAALMAARAVTKPVVALSGLAERIGRRRYREVGPASSRSDEIGQLERAMVDTASELERQEATIAEEARRRGDLSRFMAPELVSAIVRGEHSLELGGERCDVTVLFADVVAFTPFAERRAPEEVVALLNELFSLLTEVVFRHDGVVDKFVGDSLMAMWGAPVAADDHADRALAAAEDMLRFLEPAAVLWRDRFGVEVRLGIGVASGAAIVGNIGSDKRMEYTAIGDTVNVAARLETLARPNQILVSEETQRRATQRFSLKSLGAMRLPGRSAETQVFELEP